VAGPSRTADRTAAEAGQPSPPAAGPGGRASLPSRLPRRPRPRRRTVVLGAVGLVVVGAFGVWALFFSHWLRVDHVSVHGQDVLTAERIRQTADIPLGTPLASVDEDAVRAHLLTRLRRLDDVDVVRAWPHGIGLKVTERQPVLLVRRSGRYVEVDDEGVRFATVRTAPPHVPLLELRVKDSPTLKYFGRDRLRREAVDVAAVLPPEVARDTRVIEVRSYDAIRLRLGEGRTVVWGSGEQPKAKAESLRALLKASPHATHFDVSVPTSPASAP
jgi:cell division protein FtsQ